MIEPNISVLMTSYNNENTIEEAINSVLNQTYKNITLLILDDCSNDNTYKIIKSIKDKNKNLKIFRNKENVGLTKSLNILINKVTTEFIARQDADDISLPNRLEEQIDYLLNNDLDACTTRSINKKTSKKIPGFSFYLPIKLLLLYKNPFVHGTLLINKSVLNKIGNYNENFYFAQDFKLMKDLIDKKFKVGILNKVLYKLNMENNISTLYADEQKYYAACAKKGVLPIGKD
jgi:glycosyltransferase involved in cell wall biosynthesis